MGFIEDYKQQKAAKGEKLLPEIEAAATKSEAEIIAERLFEYAKTHPRTDIEKTEPVQKANKMPALQLPLWPEPVRGAPNTFLRSALFAAIQGKTRSYKKGVEIAAQKGVSMKFTGLSLDQSDFNVWLQAAHLARLSPSRDTCVFTAYSFLKTIGRSRGKANYEWLKEVLTRLQGSVISIQNEAGRWENFNLLTKTAGDDQSAVIGVKFDQKLIKLFGFDGWSALELEQRQALKGKPLALWLHGFYASHAQPYPLTVDYLRELSGSQTKAKGRFKTALKEAFVNLDAITGQKTTIEGDLVTVERLPSSTQARHLIRKAVRRVTKTRKK